MKQTLIWEHNGDDSLVYLERLPGAFVRGASLAQALEKIEREARSYSRWAKLPLPGADCECRIVQEKPSGLNVRDADSDVIFESERAPLTTEAYQRLKALALASARDFHALYASVPDADATNLLERSTFYGAVPRTAREMYAHTKNVNGYYFAEIGIDADNEGTILECRQRGFLTLEAVPGFLERPPEEGSYGEEWSLRKLLRRFLWHDRIHARAMYKMAASLFGKDGVADPFFFGTENGEA